ncbi:MAG: 1-aminocyclopropane-1-carboxylate deaminase/D-cysteine desulfhydrase [Gammaproteobacteria bacterium]|nr:1-aminocyclopropane-1-carboxylate deaminase/D-cysteine desulfhydrase [Gammaproteobacteria bacterium]
MKIFNNITAPVQALVDPVTREHGISLFIKREDLNHPEIMGNKLRKLKYNLLAAKEQNITTLLSFGGAFSNHILALSAAGRIFNFSTIGIIRGDELESKPLNPVLLKAKQNGMQLFFISRSDYREKESAGFIKKLHLSYGNFFMIPEGGSNKLAVNGAAEIMDDLDEEYDLIACACGTGGTLAGIIEGAFRQNKKNTQITGFQILDADSYMSNKISSLVSKKISKGINWNINADYHFGGYAKTNTELLDFIRWFKISHNIDLDYIYTGKMMFGLYQLIKASHFKEGSRLLAIHTGGTQTAKLPD